jgi:hypothetical protein
MTAICALGGTFWAEVGQIRRRIAYRCARALTGTWYNWSMRCGCCPMGGHHFGKAAVHSDIGLIIARAQRHQIGAALQRPIGTELA